VKAYGALRTLGAYSTRSRKTLLLNRWVLPHWGKFDLRAIKTIAVEQWLKTLVTTKFGDPKPLAGGTKEKIRDAMSSVFNHAIRWEFTDRNPITGPTKRAGVRVSAKRQRTPDILEIAEIQSLLAALDIRERAMVFLDMPSGLRRGELAGLIWGYFDFKNLHVSDFSVPESQAYATRVGRVGPSWAATVQQALGGRDE
jgi:integrase